MSQLLLRLHQASLLAGSPSAGASSLLPAAAAALTGSSSSSSSIWTAAFQQTQQQQQPQQLFQQQPSLQPHSQQTHSSSFSTSTAAGDAAVLRLNTPPLPLPCMLHTPKPSKQSLGSANTIRYPYPLPPAYSSRRWQLRNLDGQPLGAVELPGVVFNVPVRVDILHQVVRWQRAKARQGTHKTKDRSEVSGGGRKPWQQKGSGRARQGSIRAPQWRGGGTVHGPVPRSYAFDLPRKVRRLGLKCALSAKANEGRLILLDSLTPSGRPKTKQMAGKLQDLLNAQAAASGSVAARLLPDPEEGGLSAFVQQQLQLQQKAKQLPAPADAAAADGAAAEAAADADEAEVSLQQEATAEPAAAVEGSNRRQQAGPRLSAVLIDSAKDGEDGGELMRRAVRNLPGIEVVPARGANVLSLMRRDYLILTQPGLDALVTRLMTPINRLGAAGLAFRQKLQQRREAAARQRLIERNLRPACLPSQRGQQQQQQQQQTAVAA